MKTLLNTVIDKWMSRVARKVYLNPTHALPVIPAKAGIQLNFCYILDPGLRRGDEFYHPTGE